jgi:hypothetical protein
VIGIGTIESAFMAIGMRIFHHVLASAGIQYVFYESLVTAREWFAWRRDPKEFAPRLFKETK